MEKEFQTLIEITSEQLGLAQPSVIEKDIYVTHVLCSLAKLENEYFRLTFSGGTCLSKAHRITQRLSEDVDFKIEKKREAIALSPTRLRTQLRVFRLEILERLKKTGFFVDEAKMKIENMGRHLQIQLSYQSIYPRALSLRPHILLEFTAVEVHMETEILPITTLVGQVLGEKANQVHSYISCVSILETAAEKWVGLTRRVAAIKRGKLENDIALVRHLYDFYQIKKTNKIHDSFSELIIKVIERDRVQFKHKHSEFFENPKKEIELALQILISEPIWKESYQYFLNDMVYQKNPVDYDNALKIFLECDVLTKGYMPTAVA